MLLFHSNNNNSGHFEAKTHFNASSKHKVGIIWSNITKKKKNGIYHDLFKLDLFVVPFKSVGEVCADFENVGEIRVFMTKLRGG